MRAALLLAVLLSLTPAAQLRLDYETLDPRAKEWLEAAKTHRPGETDAGFQQIREWDARRLFLALQKINERRWDTELNEALERAALLHADLALLSRHTGRATSIDGWDGPVGTMVQDGRRVGSQALDAHVEFGRKILASLRGPRDHVDTPRVRQWYRTIAADFAYRHWLADLLPHLEAARKALPNDAGLLFDSGCLFETLASAQVQAGAPPKPKPSSRAGEVLKAAVFYVSLNLEDAERYYRSALKVNPDYAEARARLGRVLTQRGRHRDAVRLLMTPGDSTDPVVQYFAALSLGEALDADGQTAAARDAYVRASHLYPNAQTPLIAMARLSREIGDGAMTQEALARLARLPGGEKQRHDPWWEYFDCNGRNVAGEMEALWRLYRDHDK